MRRKYLVLLVLTMSVSPGWAAGEAGLLTAADLASFENPPADARIQYGDGSLQFGDLRIPAGSGPHPVAVFVHGGCWLSAFDIAHSSKLTAALTRNGIATWSLEYRRVGDEGGGWPGTFQDVANGADHLVSIAKDYELDLSRVIFMGHSAGGQLAIWLAARGQIPANTAVSAADPLSAVGVLALTPAPDLQGLHEQQVCGDVVDKLMGGSPGEFPDRYRLGDPMQISPGDVPQVLVVGAHDTDWAPSGLRYFRAATARGDNIRLIEAPNSGHFEVIDPESSSWSVVLEAAFSLFEVD